MRVAEMPDAVMEAWSELTIQAMREGNSGHELPRPPQPALVRVTTTEFEGEGNPRWLSGIQWCVNRRAKLRAMDAPAQKASTEADPTKPGGARPDNDMSELSDEQLDKLIAAEQSPADPAGQSGESA